MSPLRLLAATALAAAIGAATVVSAFAAHSVRAARLARPAVQDISLAIRGGDRIVGPNFALAPGVAVRLTIRNYTHEFHTFTIPGLKVSVLVLPSSGHSPRATVVKFTAHTAGTFRWHCAICPSGMHGRGHGMGGTVYVIIDPSALP
jgi:plastocyanin